MAGPDSRTSSNRYALLVEGQNDEHVVWHICKRNEFEPPEIIDKKGFEKLGKSISSELKVPDRKAVDILVDANDDPQARWASIKGRLLKVGITIPEAPDPNGTIIEDAEDLPRIGIWMMPDNVSQGYLEHFVEKMIPAGDPVWPLSQKYIEGIPDEHRRFKERHNQKAKTHAWLAAREKPGLFMGQAIGAQELHTSGELVIKFTSWLQELFKFEAPDGQ